MKNKNYGGVICVVLVAVVLIVCAIVLVINEPGQPNISVPNTVTDLEKKLDGVKNSTNGAKSANLYFDNTKSMYGYVYGGNESMYAIACKDIMYVLQRYNENSINSLVPDAEGILRWEKRSGATGMGDIVGQGFYTFSGKFDNKNGQFGPLQTLFLDASSPVDFEQLNVFITDLAEQNLNGNVLAKAINNIVMNREDYSVAIYCVISSFDGIAAIPDSGKTVNGKVKMRDEYYCGKRPVYFIVVGPTIDVVSVCEDINESLIISGLVEEEDFYCSKIISKRGLTYSPVTNAEIECFGNLYVDDQKDNDYQEYASAISITNSNLNFNTQIINYDEFYGEDITEKKNGCYYLFDNSISSTDKYTLGKATVNFAIPLSRLADGSVAEDVEYTIPMDRNSFKVYGYSLVEIDTTDDYGELYTEEEWQWNEISYSDLFDISEKYIEKVELDYLKPGEKIGRVKFEKNIAEGSENTQESKVYINNEALKDEEYPMEKMELYQAGESGALRVCLSLNNMEGLADKYEAISVAFKINASRNLEENIPPWVMDYTIRDVDTEDPADFFGKTLGLHDFYAFLIGKQASPTEKAEFEANMIKDVSDVVINIKLN